MPTYQYACRNADCGNRFELVQSFTDPAASVCPICEGPVRKVFSAVGVVFKGSGFYRTDSRSAANGSSGSTEKTSEKSGAASEKSGTSAEKSSTVSEKSGATSASSSESAASGSASSGSAKSSPSNRSAPAAAAASA